MAADAIRKFSRRTPDERVLTRLLAEVRYVPGSFDDPTVYERLGEILDEFDDRGRRPAEPHLLPVDRARRSSR